MNTKFILTSFFFALSFFTSCSKDYQFMLDVTKKVTLNNPVTAKITKESGPPIDSIQFFVNNKRISSQGNTATIQTAGLGVGKHIVTSLVFYPGHLVKKNNSFEIFANEKPTLYNYKIINSYPHSTKAYTQGLEYYNGFLYETTGRYGQSTLRKVDIKTGKVLQQVALDDKYFGEGMTIVKNKIIWLTWKAKKGFIYNLETFEQEKEFAYIKSAQGWGLTHNDTELIKSDGTNKIWFLDKNNQQEKRAIQAYTNKRSLKRLNELEFINGKIYANYWQKPLIAIINPKNGSVEGIINLTGLVKEMGKTQKLKAQDEVLNGIAYDSKNKRLFVTGKNWGKLFEIELIQKQ